MADQEMLPPEITESPADMEDVFEEDFEDVVGKERKLTPDGGVVKKILEAGEGYLTPEKGDSVTVHYVGTLTDGSQFDSSRDRNQPFVFKIGEGQVIKGWDIGVATMKKGEKSILTCQSDYAYGKAGSGSIPPDATLNFEVELISWKSCKALTDDGGVLKTIVQEGDGYEQPADDDEVVVTYQVKVYPEATTEEQAVADTAPVVLASPEGGVTFVTGEGTLCEGLKVAVRSMKVKEVANVTLLPEYAFGAKGREGLPPNSKVMLQLTLQEIHKVETPMAGVSAKVMSRLSPRTWSLPKKGAGVSLTGKGLLPDGTVFQEWTEAAPLQFTLDEEQAPEGLESAVEKMERGQRSIITITDPALGYGSKGYAGAAATVPADSAVTFDLTLNSFDAIKEKWSMDNAEKLAAAVKHKEKGNAAYKAGNLRRAIDQYNSAVDYATSAKENGPDPLAGRDDPEQPPSSSSDLPNPAELKKSCWLNLAAAQLKAGDFAEAVKQCSKVLETDSGNIKALYRRAQAHLGNGDLLEAERDVKSGLLLEEANKDLQLLLRKVKAALKERNKKEAALYNKMFKALGSFGVGQEQQQQPANGDVQTEAKDQDLEAPAAAADASTTMQVDSGATVEAAA